jgi:hypothetical protein
MGCDIHTFIERREHDAWWSVHYGGQFYVGRDYRLFSALAGVRSYDDPPPLYAPRGIPEDLASGAVDGYTLWIGDPGDNTPRCDRERAEVWLAKGYSKRWGKHRVTDPDAHTPSWLTAEESREVINAMRLEDRSDDWEIVTRIAEFYAERCQGSRIVFWFDN